MSQLMSGGGDAHRDRLIAAAPQVRVILEGARSDRLRRLFEYLLERTLAGESPSEQQIAAEAFNDDGYTEGGPDANVRVYMHRLRKLLDGAFQGATGPKLYVPVGEYRIRLVGEQEAAVPTEGTGVKVSMPDWLKVLPGRTFALVAAGLALVALVWVWIDHGKAPLAETLAWQTIASDNRPITVVVGDYYLFARLDRNEAAKDQPSQLVLDRSVPTREDLTILQMLDPAKADAVVDYNQQYVSSGTIEALSMVRAGFAQLPTLAHRTINLVAASQLTPEILASTNIIFVGQFSGMTPLLRDPLAQASGFRFDQGFGGVTDAKSATPYQSDGMILTDERIARRDFAYLANLPGPAGNHILVIAGIGDAGVKEAARIAGNLDQLSHLGQGSQRLSSGFEALYQVRTIKSTNVGAALVIDRPLRSGGIWDNSGNVPAYRPITTETGAATQP
ncbi:MAG: helix-turn-helix domain-containing protein [Novosphingobium sp.]